MHAAIDEVVSVGYFFVCRESIDSLLLLNHLLLLLTLFVRFGRDGWHNLHDLLRLLFLAHCNQTVCQLVHSFLIELLLSKDLFARNVTFGEGRVVSSFDESLLVRWNRQVVFKLLLLLRLFAQSFIPQLCKVFTRLLLLACQVEFESVVYLFALESDLLPRDTFNIPMGE